MSIRFHESKRSSQDLLSSFFVDSTEIKDEFEDISTWVDRDAAINKFDIEFFNRNDTSINKFGIELINENDTAINKFRAELEHKLKNSSPSSKDRYWYFSDFDVTVEDNSTSTVKQEGSVKSREALKSSLSTKFIFTIRNSSFEEGQLSPADYVIEDILNVHGEKLAEEVISTAWHEFYKSKSVIDHVHFLNVLRNISYLMRVDNFLPYAIAAIGHKEMMIVEAGIATFESWDNEAHKCYLEK